MRKRRYAFCLVALFAALSAVGCASASRVTYIPEGASYTAESLAESLEASDAGSAADVTTEEASDVRQSALADLRSHGDEAARLADVLTSEFPAGVAAVPYAVEHGSYEDRGCLDRLRGLGRRGAERCPAAGCGSSPTTISRSSPHSPPARRLLRSRATSCRPHSLGGRTFCIPSRAQQVGFDRGCHQAPARRSGPSASFARMVARRTTPPKYPATRACSREVSSREPQPENRALVARAATATCGPSPSRRTHCCTRSGTVSASVRLSSRPMRLSCTIGIASSRTPVRKERTCPL